jgi:hypothetical protein
MDEPNLSQLSNISTTDTNMSNLISSLKIIINQQYHFIKKHEKEIMELQTSLSDIKHMLSGRQFIRSMSCESELDNITY